MAAEAASGLPLGHPMFPYGPSPTPPPPHPAGYSGAPPPIDPYPGLHEGKKGPDQPLPSMPGSHIGGEFTSSLRCQPGDDQLSELPRLGFL